MSFASKIMIMRLTIRTKNREGERAGLLHVCAGCASGEGRGLAEGRLRDGDDFGAVDEVARVVADNGELSHGGLEVAHHELLVVDHVLPETGHVGITGDSKVGL